MIIGNPSILAIESSVTHAYEKPSLLALGFFVVHVGGHRYGVYNPMATALGCSFDEVERRISRRGSHVAHFAMQDAEAIAEAYYSAFYAEEQESSYFDISLPEFSDIIHLNHIVWAPDGDEAFDDGSYILHFDIQERVRVIAFKWNHDSVRRLAILSDVWLAADDFYGILQQWHDAFKAEWMFCPKTPHV